MKQLLPLVAGLLLSVHVHAAPTESEVLTHYADLAHAMYGDSRTTAQQLQKAVDSFIAKPTEANLSTAKAAWKAARHPYQQTEAFRFGNAIVDDWEGKVNAWPLDEGLIDYVDSGIYGEESDENPYYTANIVANPKLTLSGKTIDAATIDKQLLSETLHEFDAVETNVATGYHAIEFLLWGQDLNGSNAGAGKRPASDFDTANCSNGNCARRAAYLKAATDLLVDELTWMSQQWSRDGAARAELFKDSKQGIAAIFTGMGSLSYGELAGERMKLGLMLHDPEEEHDCFSDNTHWSHFNDALGIRNVYTGSYTRVDGSKLEGPSVADLVAAKNAGVDKTIRVSLEATLTKMQILVDSAEKSGVAYDQLIGADNKAGNAKVMAAIDALVAQTKDIEKGVTTLGLESIAFEGSDSLDAPDKVTQ
jgi:putative iron-regulated protein